MLGRTGGAQSRGRSLAGGILQGSGCAASLAVQEPTMNLRALPIPVGSPLTPRTSSKHSTLFHGHRQTCPGITQLTWQGWSRGPACVPVHPGLLPLAFPLHLSPYSQLTPVFGPPDMAEMEANL